eukprot:5958514-Amphidinium_carterae.1
MCGGGLATRRRTTSACPGSAPAVRFACYTHNTQPPFGNDRPGAHNQKGAPNLNFFRLRSKYSL